MEFKYEAEQQDELSINVGDIIKNVVISDGGWWEGELNGKKGMFPDNFVKVITMIVLEPYMSFYIITNRGVEIVKFSTCPGTSKKPKCTCP